MTRISLVLLLLSGAYWLFTQGVRADIRAVDKDTKFPTASVVIGRTEIAWLVNHSGPLIWVARDHGGGESPFPFIRHAGFVDAVFAKFKWNGEVRQSRLPLLSGGVTRFDGIGPTGTPMTIRIFHISNPSMLVIFGILPGIALVRMGYRGMRHSVRRIQVVRRRRSRCKLGICPCGYDLRAASGRCPECGRALRWAPVAVA